MERQRSLGTSSQNQANFGFCGITLFKRSGANSKKGSRSGSQSSEQDQTHPPQQHTEPGNLKHPRRSRPDSPRDREEPEGSYQPLKRQHSTSMDDEPHAGPAPIATPQLSGQVHAVDAASGASTGEASSRRISVEVKSHSFPQAHPRGPGLRTEQGPVSPRPVQQHIQQQSVCPPYGHKAVIGRRPKMEDAYSAVPFLLEVPISEAPLDELVPPRIASSVRNASTPTAANSEASAATGTGQPQPQQGQSSSVGGPEASGSAGSGGHSRGLPPLHLSSGASGGSEGSPVLVETLHFFGVFDGHGGADAAMHCARTMHERVRQVLSSITSPIHPTSHSPHAAAGEASSSGGGTGNGNGAQAGAAGQRSSGIQDMDLPNSPPARNSTASGALGPRGTSPRSEYVDASADLLEGTSSTASETSFLDCDVDSGPGDREGTNKVEGLPCTSETVEQALTRAFHMTDEDFGQAENAALVGTTAVVALVGTRMLYVANCGDSRAVLCRNGAAVALTDDHKAAREDETARVEAAGGQILFWNGVRVMGVLAVSRAIGDHCLRPFVIAQPEVTIITRHAQDELLLLASDGLWDVMNNQEACTLAKKCLQRARQRGASRAKASSIAASVLVRAAVDRGSRDNVTVVIVDLSPATPEELEEEARKAEQESSAGDGGGNDDHARRSPAPPSRGRNSTSTDGAEGPPGVGKPPARARRPSLDVAAAASAAAGGQQAKDHSVPSPFATLPPTAPSPFEQMQQQQPPSPQQSPHPPAPDAALLSPFGSVPVPTDDGPPF